MKKINKEYLKEAGKFMGTNLGEVLAIGYAARLTAGLFTDNELIKSGVQFTVSMIAEVKRIKDMERTDILEERIAELEAKIAEMENNEK